MRIAAAAPTLSATVDDSVTSGTNKFSYTGSWVNCGGCNPPAYNNGFRYAYTTGNSFTLTFTGTQAKIFAVKEAVGGIASVSVDGGTAVDVDYYASSQSIQNVYTTPVLAHGTHTVKFTVSGRKNVASGSPTINIDKAEIYVGGASDTTAPTTAITSPATNSSVTIGDAVAIAANASDNIGVTKVEFLVNGSVVNTDTSAPYSYSWDTAGKAAGVYTLTTKAYDAANNVGTSSAVAVTLAVPSTPSVPADSVRIGSSVHVLDGTNTSRGANQLIMYTYSASQMATPTNAYGVEVAVNASNVITAVNNRLQTGSTSGTAIPAGGYVLSGHGWGASDSGYTWLINNATVGAMVVVGDGGTTPEPTDTEAPVTAMTAPVNNSTATIGDTVALAATASDNVGVTKVEFLVNGVAVSTDTSAPYDYAWNTTGKAAGQYTLATKAYDAAGNVSTASPVTVTLTAPQVAITATATISGSTATLQWTVAGANPTEWTVGRDGTDSSGYGAWSTTVPGDRREHVFNYLRAGDTYNLTVSAADGRTATATITMPAAPTDTTAPSVSLTSPANGASVTKGSTVTIAANASDNIGVTKVEFLVNGSVVNTDTSAPYSYSWSTASAATGVHSISAKAYDTAGNVGTAVAVQLTLTAAPSNPGTWLSGVATNEDGNGADPAKYFGDWRGTPVQIGQTWPHTPDVWGINPSVPDSWSGFQGPMSLSYNPGVEPQADGTIKIIDWYDPATGQTYQGWRGWSAMANGNMDNWWRAAARNTKTLRQGKGTTYVSPFYEYNGNWMAWSVPRTTQGMADFRAAWERVAAIWRQEFPGVKLVLPAACSRDVPAAMMPSASSYDHIGCTIYNAWPWQGNGAEAVRLLEVGRQRALANGKSLVITEWANSGNANEDGGGGDAPGFIQAFHDYFVQHGGTGAGQLEFETFFNIDGFSLDHIMLRKNGSQVIVNPTQPLTAAKYQQLF